MSRIVTRLSLFLALTAFLLTPIGAAAAGPVDETIPVDETARAVELVNAERALYGLPALRWEHRLAGAAADYAIYMAEQGIFSHFLQDGEGLIERGEAHGYLEWSFLGENLAREKYSPEEVVAAWLASPTHRANVLSIEACHVGIGHSTGYWAMEIGC